MLDVILLERVENLGQMGDVVKVKPGYARNFLLPKGIALRANKDNLALFETQKKELEARNLKRRSEAEAVAKNMDGKEIVLVRQAGEAGQLYGSVSARDVADALNEVGFKVGRGQVVLNLAIKTLGLFNVRVSLHSEVSATVSVNIARSQDEAVIQRQTGGALIRNEEGDLVSEAELKKKADAAEAAQADAAELEEPAEAAEQETEEASA